MIVNRRDGTPIRIIAVLPPSASLVRNTRIIGIGPSSFARDKGGRNWTSAWQIDGRSFANGRDDSCDLMGLPPEAELLRMFGVAPDGVVIK